MSQEIAADLKSPNVNRSITCAKTHKKNKKKQVTQEHSCCRRSSTKARNRSCPVCRRRATATATTMHRWAYWPNCRRCHGRTRVHRAKPLRPRGQAASVQATPLPPLDSRRRALALRVSTAAAAGCRRRLEQARARAPPQQQASAQATAVSRRGLEPHQPAGERAGARAASSRHSIEPGKRRGKEREISAAASNSETLKRILSFAHLGPYGLGRERKKKEKGKEKKIHLRPSCS
jgi:hypothetical protein